MMIVTNLTDFARFFTEFLSYITFGVDTLVFHLFERIYFMYVPTNTRLTIHYLLFSKTLSSRLFIKINLKIPV
jgi:hypothetical protein